MINKAIYIFCIVLVLSNTNVSCIKPKKPFIKINNGQSRAILNSNLLHNQNQNQNSKLLPEELPNQPEDYITLAELGSSFKRGITDLNNAYYNYYSQFITWVQNKTQILFFTYFFSGVLFMFLISTLFNWVNERLMKLHRKQQDQKQNKKQAQFIEQETQPKEYIDEEIQVSICPEYLYDAQTFYHKVLSYKKHKKDNQINTLQQQLNGLEIIQSFKNPQDESEEMDLNILLDDCQKQAALELDTSSCSTDLQNFEFDGDNDQSVEFNESGIDD